MCACLRGVDVLLVSSIIAGRNGFDGRYHPSGRSLIPENPKLLKEVICPTPDLASELSIKPSI